MPRNMIVFGLFLAFLALSSQTVEELGLNLEQLENQLFLLVNHERSSRGLPELRFDPQLCAIARAHSRKMSQENKLAHDFPGYKKLGDHAVQAGLRFFSIGENLAVGDTFIMRFFHEQMLTSPGHCNNILFKDFTHLGIGIEQNGNKYYITQDFATLFQSPTR